MKYWEKSLKVIFKLTAWRQLKKVRHKLLEPILAKSAAMLDEGMLLEIRSFILGQQTKEGGFADRGGKCDLYYSLFGYFIAESFSVVEVMVPLRKYIAATVLPGKLSGAYRYCGAILYSKLIGLDETTEKLRKEIVADLFSPEVKQPRYNDFLGALSLFYLEDFFNVLRIKNRYKRPFALTGLPCTVVAATAVLLKMAGNQQTGTVEALKSFYLGNGGFAALHGAPEEDLLSTGVTLFALNFLGADIRLIKPDCLIFVDGLYDNGGFRATASDTITDAEYTFYGLLALGSMG